MRSLSFQLSFLPPGLFLLAAQIMAQQEGFNSPPPTAVRKMPPDANSMFRHEYAAFPAGIDPLHFAEVPKTPRDALHAENLSPNERRELAAYLQRHVFSPEEREQPHFQPPFNPHEHEVDIFRRAAQVLRLLSKRDGACPGTMQSCDEVGFPNKCCYEGEVCVEVADASVGNVACCPENVSCGGGVGNCPTAAVTCPESLGGGCCLSGYVCRGSGCEFKLLQAATALK